MPVDGENGGQRHSCVIDRDRVCVCVRERAEFCVICSLLEQQLALLPSWHCHVNYVQWDSVPWCLFFITLSFCVLSYLLFCLSLFFPHLSLFLLLFLPSSTSIFHYTPPWFLSHPLPPSPNQLTTNIPVTTLILLCISSGYHPLLSKLSQLPCCLRSIKLLHCSEVKHLCNSVVKQIIRLAH